MKKIVLSGDRPNGKIHLGHYIGSIINRIKLQDACIQYIILADTQVLSENINQYQQIFEYMCDIVKDYLSVGIDPYKTTIFVQSQIPELAELVFYYMNLVTVNRLKRNPTVKKEIKQKNFNKSIPVGFFCYPISQAADITEFKADLVPVGSDQIPMIEQTNDIVIKFNKIYKSECLKIIKPLLSDTPCLIGIDGKVKASKSLNNTIYLSDEPDVIKHKVFSMFTDPNHIYINTPGKVDRNVVFNYLDAFYNDKEAIEDLKVKYRKGGLGDVTIKNLLNDTLQKLLTPIRERRNSFKRKEIVDLLYYGSITARKIVKDTVREVREAIGLVIF